MDESWTCTEMTIEDLEQIDDETIGIVIRTWLETYKKPVVIMLREHKDKLNTNWNRKGHGQ